MARRSRSEDVGSSWSRSDQAVSGGGRPWPVSRVTVAPHVLDLESLLSGAGDTGPLRSAVALARGQAAALPGGGHAIAVCACPCERQAAAATPSSQTKIVRLLEPRPPRASRAATRWPGRWPHA